MFSGIITNETIYVDSFDDYNVGDTISGYFSYEDTLADGYYWNDPSAPLYDDSISGRLDTNTWSWYMSHLEISNGLPVNLAFDDGFFDWYVNIFEDDFTISCTYGLPGQIAEYYGTINEFKPVPEPATQGKRM